MSILANIIEKEMTENGEIPAGFLFASVKNIGDQTASVNATQLESGEAKTYPFVGKGCGAIPYEVNGTTLRVMYYL